MWTNQDKELIGKKFSHLQILDIFRKSHDRRRHCKYLCDCGKQSQVRLSDILSGKRASCGCLSGLPPGESSIRRVFHEYISNSKKKNIEFSLDYSIVKELLLSNCYYCGKIPSRTVNRKKLKGSAVVSGIDRLDNSSGYIKDNCVSCCKECNYRKSTTSHEDFCEWIKTVYLNLGLDQQ